MSIDTTTSQVIHTGSSIGKSFRQSDGIDLSPEVKVFLGEAALDELNRAFDYACDEDAVGRTWMLRSSHGPWEEMPFGKPPADVGTMEAILIDSGNKHGDMWKYTYYPRTKVGLFCLETDEALRPR